MKSNKTIVMQPENNSFNPHLSGEYKATFFNRDSLIPPLNVEINLLEIGGF